MFNFETAKKDTLVNIIRFMQEDLGETISAHSTLMRKRPADLQTQIEAMISDGTFDITDDGNVVRREVDGETEEFTDEEMGAANEPEPVAGDEPDASEPVDVLDIEAPVVIKFPAKATKPAKATPMDTPRPRGRKSGTLPTDGVLTVVVAKPPYRPSKRLTNFSKVRTGMTVAEYLKENGKETRPFLIWYVEQGVVRVDDPA